MFGKRRIINTAVLILLLIASAYPQTGKRVRVAVMNFKVDGSEITASTALTDRFCSELMNTDMFDVMERSQMETMLKEQGFQQSGACENDACAVQAGKILGVSAIVLGSVGQVGKLYTVSARIVSIQTGRILISKTEDCDCPVEMVLTHALKNLANKLAGNSSETADTVLPKIPPGKEGGKRDKSANKYWSMVVPGLGQLKQDRKIGWLYMLGTTVTSAWYFQQLSVHNTNLDEYDRMRNIYIGDVTKVNQERAASAYDKTESSYTKSNMILYGIAGIYAINVIDAFIFSRHKSAEHSCIQGVIRPMYSNVPSTHHAFGLRLEVRL